jgi:hypothetical protein
LRASSRLRLDARSSRALRGNKPGASIDGVTAFLERQGGRLEYKSPVRLEETAPPPASNQATRSSCSQRSCLRRRCFHRAPGARNPPGSTRIEPHPRQEGERPSGPRPASPLRLWAATTRAAPPFTRERSQVRNPPRPPFASVRTLAISKVAGVRCLKGPFNRLSHTSDLWGTARRTEATSFRP